MYLPTGVINPIPMSKQVLTNPVPTPLNPISFFSGKIKSSFGRLFKKRKDKTNKIPTSAADSMGGRISQKGKEYEFDANAENTEPHPFYTKEAQDAFDKAELERAIR